MAERLVDFVAAGRVAKRVELKRIRAVDVSAKCSAEIVGGPLEAKLDHDCAVVSRETNRLKIACNYSFVASAAETQVAEAAIGYLLDFEVQGSEPIADEDLAEFAFANGTLHSWPFVREFLYGLTSRMGYPPYTLPVFHFKPKPREEKEAQQEGKQAQEGEKEPKAS